MLTKQSIIKKLEEYKAQKNKTEIQVHMLEGAIQALELLVKEMDEPIQAGPTSIKGDK